MSLTILLFHPHPKKSHANRALADAARALPDTELVDMTALYPDGAIDLDVEVARMLGTRRLVLQFPVQWYSTPPLLKTWQDEVLTRMYYIRAADEGDRLKGLPVMVAATAGNAPSAYAPDGINLFALPDLLRPLNSTAHRCGWTWGEPFLVYNANRSTAETLAAAAANYAARLTGWRERTDPLTPPSASG